MEDEVLEFINRRFKTDCHWCDGNCFWFATILNKRFPHFKIWLFPIENHFMIGDGEIFYDWNGIRHIEDCDEIPMEWDKVEEFDSSYYNHLIRDCVN